MRFTFQGPTFFLIKPSMLHSKYHPENRSRRKFYNLTINGLYLQAFSVTPYDIKKVAIEHVVLLSKLDESVD